MSVEDVFGKPDTKISDEVIPEDEVYTSSSTSDVVQDEPQELPKVEGNQPMPKQNTQLGVPVNIGFEFDSTELPGVQVVEMGQDVKSNPVERIKFSKGNRSLISILSNRPVVIKTHYKEGLGSFLSAGPEFTDLLGLPTVRYLFPIIEYDTSKDGKIVSTNVAFKVLSVGQTVYEDLKTIQIVHNGSVTGIDLIVTCKREDYQDIAIGAIGTSAYLQSSKIINEATQFWKENQKNMVLAVAKKISYSQLLESLQEDDEVARAEGSVPKGANTGNVNFNTVFDD